MDTVHGPRWGRVLSNSHESDECLQTASLICLKV